MAVRLRLAALGHTMEHGKVVEWYVSEGGEVVQGTPLFAVETDKAVVDVEAPADGVLLRIDAPVNREYPVGATLAWIGDAGEVLPDQTDETIAAPAAVSDEQRVTPVARRLAERHGVDADRLEGTGPGGRITKEDVKRAIDAGTAPALEVKASGEPAVESNAPGEPPHDVIPLKGIRRVTAQRLSAHWTGAPQVTEGIDIDMTEVRAWRTANRDQWRAAFGVRPSLNDIVLKAVAVALEGHPALNSALVDGAIHRYRVINLGVAMDVEDGLVVPVLPNAGQLDLGAIASAVADLTARAKAGKLTLEDFERGDLHGQQPERAGRRLVHPGAEPTAVRAAGGGQDAAHTGRGGARGRDQGRRHVRAHVRSPGAGRRAGGAFPREAQAAARISRYGAVCGTRCLEAIRQSPPDRFVREQVNPPGSFDAGSVIGAARAVRHQGLRHRSCRSGPQVSTRRAVSGALSRILSKALAAPVGPRLPCSQLRIVSCGTSMRRANSTCVSPRRLRTPRAKRAMSRIASASSWRACCAISSSVVASSTA